MEVGRASNSKHCYQSDGNLGVCNEWSATNRDRHCRRVYRTLHVETLSMRRKFAGYYTLEIVYSDYPKLHVSL